MISANKPDYLKEEDNYIAGYGIASQHKQELWLTWESEDVMCTEFAYIFDPTSKSLYVLSRDDERQRWAKSDVIDLGAIIYRVRGGETTIENGELVCREYNQKKGAKVNYKVAA
jgi:hypothetical protein